MQGVVGSNPTVPTNYTESIYYSSNGAFLVFMALCMGRNQREFYMISVTLPDGSQRQFEHPISVYDVAKSIGDGLANATIAGKVAGELVDSCELIDKDVSLSILTVRDEQGLEIIRGCYGLNLVGCDLMEVSPPYDTSGNTSLLAANLIFEMLCSLPGCVRRR